MGLAGISNWIGARERIATETGTITPITDQELHANHWILLVVLNSNGCFFWYANGRSDTGIGESRLFRAYLNHGGGGECMAV